MMMLKFHVTSHAYVRSKNTKNNKIILNPEVRGKLYAYLIA